MIIKRNDFYMALYTYEGLTAWVKTAEYKNSFNEVKTVVTELVVTNEQKEVVYKNISSNWICYYNDNKGLSIVNIIEDILYYLAHNEYKAEYKKNTVDNVLYNSSVAMLNIKLFRKEHTNKITEQKAIEENNKKLKQINKLEIEIVELVNNINKYELMRYNKPNQLNNYKYEFITSNSYKAFIFGSNLNEVIEGYNNIIQWLNNYLYYISNDYDPIEFMEFDKVA